MKPLWKEPVIWTFAALMLLLVAFGGALVYGNVARNAELAAACEEVGAVPFQVRAWNSLCELPDGTIIRNPGW